MVLRGHRGLVKSVALSADGRWAVSGSGDATIKVWDSKSGDLLKTWGGPEEVDGDTGIYSAAVAPNSARIIAGGVRSIEVWSLP